MKTALQMQIILSFSEQNLFGFYFLLQRMNLKLLIAYFCILLLSNCRSTGIRPTQMMKNLPYFMTQLITFTPQSFNLSTSNFDSTHQVYRLQIGLQRRINNIIDQNIITTGFNYESSGYLGYSVNSSIIAEGSKAQIEVKVMGKAVVKKLTFTLIALGQTLQMGNVYMGMFELKVGSQGQTQMISMADFENYEFYPFVKSVNIESASVQGSSLESMGFITKGEKKFTENSGDFYELSLEKVNAQIEQNINATYVVLAVNQLKFKQAAQFSTLQVLVTWQQVKTDSMYLIPQRFDIQYKSNSLFGYSQWPGLTMGSSYVDFTYLQNTGVKFSSDFVNNRFKYLALQLVDYKCTEENSSFKFKGNGFCYACEEGKVVNSSQSNVWNEYRLSINNDKGEKIRASISGYHFGDDGTIAAVCGERKNQKEQKVQDIENNSSHKQEENPKTSLKQKILQNLSNLYNYIASKTNLNIDSSNLTFEQKSSSQAIKSISEKPVERIK